jgi:toxin ParE1/3/4
MTHSVVFSARAERHLDAIFAYVEEQAGRARAENFVGGIVAHCQGFNVFPERGSRRDDIRIGLRIVGYRRRVTIVFTVEPETVAIVGVYYGGQDYETELSDDPGSDG